MLGIFLLFLWIYPKQEVMLIYTTGHTFRIEASEDFIKQVWDTVMRMQRLQD
jgi:hypothetical protein